MTPLGRKLREMRAERGVTMQRMASELGVSAAYLSALEHGKRGAPSWQLLQRIIRYFNVIWDEAEELERLAFLSNPRIVVDTAGLTPEATELANRLAERIKTLEAEELRALIAILSATAPARRRG